MGEAKHRGERADRFAQAQERQRQRRTYRNRPEAQAGIAPADRYVATAEDGHPMDASGTVPPIVLRSDGGRTLKVVGTGFFVGPALRDGLTCDRRHAR
jgi:hypothetical protein